MSEKNGWVQYNSVDFISDDYKWIEMKYLSTKGTVIYLKQNNKKANELKIPASACLTTKRLKISNIKSGRYDIELKNIGCNPIEIDWLRFK